MNKYKMVYTPNCQHEDYQCVDCCANIKDIDCKTFIASRVKEGLEDCNYTSRCYQEVETNKASDLLACPCCGSKAITIEREETIGSVIAHTLQIYCSGKGCNMSCKGPHNRVLNMWNKRVKSNA